MPDSLADLREDLAAINGEWRKLVESFPAFNAACAAGKFEEAERIAEGMKTRLETTLDAYVRAHRRMGKLFGGPT